VVAQAVEVAADTVRRGRAELDDPVVPPVEVSRRAQHVGSDAAYGVSRRRCLERRRGFPAPVAQVHPIWLSMVYLRLLLVFILMWLTWSAALKFSN